MGALAETCGKCGRELAKIYVKGMLFGFYCESCDADFLPEGYEAVYDHATSQSVLGDY